MNVNKVQIQLTAFQNVWRNQNAVVRAQISQMCHILCTLITDNGPVGAQLDATNFYRVQITALLRIYYTILNGNVVVFIMLM